MRKLLRTLLLIWMAVFLALPAGAMTVYYVDFGSGNDAHDGLSIATAFKTIPGTQKTDGSAALNTAWGSITTSAKIQDNTLFNIKAGTMMTSAIGGFLWVGSGSSDFYTQGCTNVVFQDATNGWGSGGWPTIDATGMTVPIAWMQIQIDGVTVNGLTISNCQQNAIQVKEKQGSSLQETNTTLINLNLLACGASATDDLSGSGQSFISVRHANGLLISNVVCNGRNAGGSNNWSEGITIGESHQHVINALITSCTSSNLQGDPTDNDSGIGFKAFNSLCTWSNCLSVFNLKGFDLGEINGDGGPITYKVISCTTSNNFWGCNFNGVGEIPYSGLPINFYIINTLSVSNYESGLHVYAGPYNLYVVHNTFDLNGNPGDGIFNGVGAGITPDGTTDTNLINVFVYNNIFQNCQDYALQTSYDAQTNNDSFFIDWNSYKQRASEHFALWSLSYGPAQATFDYGANGPGHASGNWYNWYQVSGTSITLGTGHFHADAHSKGTGATDTSLPSFGAGYTLTAPYGGTNLSGMSWFIPEMGIDRSGKARAATPAIGMYEAPGITTTLTLTSSKNPSLTTDTVTFTDNVQTNSVNATDATGSATIFVDGISTSTGSVVSGQVQFMVSGLAAGTHTITVTYAGDAQYSGSNGGPLSQVVNSPAPTGVWYMPVQPGR